MPCLKMGDDNRRISATYGEVKIWCRKIARGISLSFALGSLPRESNKWYQLQVKTTINDGIEFKQIDRNRKWAKCNSIHLNEINIRFY